MTANAGGKKKQVSIAIAGGGTGGHVFPGIAILEALAEKCDTRVMWLGTGRPVEHAAVHDRPWEYKILEVRPIHGMTLVNMTRAWVDLPLKVAGAARLLRQFRPEIVLGIGGYVSGPALVAARIMNIPCAIHEQNTVPGLANRIGARLAKRIFLGFKGAEKWFPPEKTLVTGNPVRRELIEGARHHGSVKDAGPDRSFRVLVMGGSQGAKAINRLAGSALCILFQEGMKIEVLHQTGPEDAEDLRQVYRSAGMPGRAVTFLDDMKGAYTWADLVISRAGAGTCSELAVMGKPSILIPYPHAASGHQEANALEMKSAGAAVVLREQETGPEKLASAARQLIEGADKLREMGFNAREMGRPDAGAVIAGELLKMIISE